MTALIEEYYVLSNDYSKVNYVVNMEDEREAKLAKGESLSSSHPINFECVCLKRFEPREAPFDVSVNTEILFDLDFSPALSSLHLYKNALLPCKIMDKGFVYLHCCNVIDIEEDGAGFDFERLADIPLQKRLVFKPSFGSIVVFFHKSVIQAIIGVKTPSYARCQKVADWSAEWEMS